MMCATDVWICVHCVRCSDDVAEPSGGFSLLLTLVDRWLHSPCGWSCGYTLQDSAQQNLGLFSRLCLCKAQSNESNVLQHSNVKEK